MVSPLKTVATCLLTVCIFILNSTAYYVKESDL